MATNLVCRLCLTKSKSLKSIFGRQKKFILIDFIAEFTQVVISKNDGRSSKICEICLENVKIVYEMKKLCIETDLISKEKMMEDTRIKQEINNSANQYPSQCVVIKSEEIIIEPEQVLEETKTVLDENELELEPKSYSPTHIEYLDEVEDEQNLNKTPSIVDIMEETQLSEDSNHSISTEWLPVESNKPERVKRRKGKSDQLHQCFLCGKIFKSASNLKGHEITHNPIKTLECKVCKKMFRMNCDLTKHLNIHKNERNYKCKVCLKGFNNIATLKEHFRLKHSGEKNHWCKICNIGFPLKHQLKSHNRTHTGEKPYKCHLCEKKYSHNIDLKRHIMLHTGIKPFKCPHCDRTFTKKSNMECHIPVHTGEKPYKCNICSKEFRQPCPYKKHMKMHIEAGDQVNDK